MSFKDEQDGELKEFSDSHIFLMCLVPLKIYFHPNGDETSGVLAWNNDLPSSSNLCRPIKMIFKKENSELTRSEFSLITKQIEALNPSVVTMDNQNLTVKATLVMSMVDGKVLNDLTETSSQACHICRASGKALSLPYNGDEAADSRDYEVLPILHAYIRSMELLLNVAYRIPFEKWRMSGDCQEFKDRQSLIRQSFREIGLRISEPRPSGGNSNDGNTARRFFSSPEVTARITGLYFMIVRFIKRFQRYSIIYRLGCELTLSF